MIDKAAIFTDILKRNALRRESGLPEWPLRETYLKGVEYASWREFAQQHGARIRMQVLAEQQLRHGPGWPMSGGGRMAFSCLVAQAVAKSFHDQRSTQSSRSRDYGSRVFVTKISPISGSD